VKRILRDTSTTALALVGFAVLGAGLLSGVQALTHDTIAASERAARLKMIAETLPAGLFDNDIVADSMPLAPDPRLGLKRPGSAYVARQAGVPVGVVLEAIAPDGYAGDIQLLVGVHADGRVAGVRVTSHHETPGLGDYIETGKSDWIHQFDQHQPPAPGEATWSVRKDGGGFDYMAGATITPRAVIKAVRKSLEYFAAHRDQLLAAPAGKPSQGG